MSGLGFGFVAGLPLAQKVIRVVAIIGVVLAIAGLSYCQGRSDGAANWQLKLEKANRDFLEQKARADALAADQRLADTLAVSEREKELRDVIRSVPDSAPDAVRVQLGCARLRAAGRSATDLPAVCRPQGGAEARPAG